MPQTSSPILVVGATGQQGGATVRRLLEGKSTARALVRDPTAPAALALARAGVELAVGDIDDQTSLEHAMRGVGRVFAVAPTEFSPRMQPGFGYADEVRFGKKLADAAKAVGVQHFVYSSVAQADRMAGLRNYSKYEIEKHIRSINLPATILRPVWFMENFVDPLFGVQTGALALAIRSDVRLQLVAVADIARLAALAFDEPANYLGRTIEIAGDALSPPEIAAALSRAIGREVPLAEIPLDMVRTQSEEAFKAFEFMNREPASVDIAALRVLLPDLADFETWLQTTGKSRLKQLFAGVA
jgi:uncharacterized protein YbjT (DUF2867 family)